MKDKPQGYAHLTAKIDELKREVVRLKGEAESWEKVFDRTCELLADAKTELAAAIAAERERCAKVAKGTGRMETYNDGIQDSIDLLKTLSGNSIDYIIDRLQDYQYAYEKKQGVAQKCAAAIRKGE